MSTSNKSFYLIATIVAPERTTLIKQGLSVKLKKFLRFAGNNSNGFL